MRKVLFLLGELADADIDWLVGAGTTRQVGVGATLIQKGKPITDIFFLLEGRLSVRVNGSTPEEIAMLMSGEIVGELSFITSGLPMATVVCVSDATVLSVPRRALSRRLERDAEFAARFYRVLAVFLANRLSRTTLRLGFGKSDSLVEEEPAIDEIDPALLESVSLAGRRFEYLLQRCRTLSHRSATDSRAAIDDGEGSPTNTAPVADDEE